MNQLISLELSHIKKIYAFKLHFDGRAVTKIIGPNESGKSTIIDALELLFGWTKQKDVVSHGSSNGRIVAAYTNELGEKFTVRRTFRPSGDELSIRPDSSASIKSPQEYLTRIFGGISFSPVAFYESTTKEQEDIILEVAGLTPKLEKLRVKYDRIYAERHDAKLLMTEARDALKRIPEVKETKFKDSETVMRSYQKALKKNQENDIIRRQYEHDKQKSEDYLREESQLGQNIADEKKTIEEVEKEIQRLLGKQKALTKKVSELKLKLEDTTRARVQAEIRVNHSRLKVESLVDVDVVKYEKEINALTDHNKNADLWRARDEAQKDYKSKVAVWNKLSDDLKEVISQKKEMLMTSEYPIEGLVYSNDGLKYKDCLLENCSSSERLLIACHIMYSRQPGLNVMLVDNAESLDSDHKKVLFDFAEKTNLHVLMAEVKDSDYDKDAVVIVDGAIIQNPYEE